jgi:PTS system galactitol-specific IIA component
MAHLFRPELCLCRLEAPDAAAVISAAAAALEQHGLVHSTFAEAVLTREVSSPTGLPLPGRKVAIPHADPEHVITPAVAVATLAMPVTFAEMGNPDGALQVELVALLALTDKESAQQELVRLIELFQQATFVDRLVAATDAEALFRLLEAGEES